MSDPILLYQYDYDILKSSDSITAPFKFNKFSVKAIKPLMVFDAENAEIPNEVSQPISISGSFTISLRDLIAHENRKDLDIFDWYTQTSPFDVTIVSRSQYDNKKYWSRVIGINITRVLESYIGDNITCDFVATNVVEWTPYNDRKIFVIEVSVLDENNNIEDYLSETYLANKLNEGICYVDDVFKIIKIKKIEKEIL